MSGSDRLPKCPECDEPLYAHEEWQITDRSKIGEPVGESIEGDYAHARCLNGGDSMSTIGRPEWLPERYDPDAPPSEPPENDRWSEGLARRGAGNGGDTISQRSDYVELAVPPDLDEATRQYERDAVVHGIVDIVSKETDSDPVDVLRRNLGDTLRVHPERLGLIEHDKDLEKVAWPSNVRSVDTDSDDPGGDDVE